ncbi:hypothetical protein AB4Y44_24805, partial [Paraburkholderia sp. BR10937]
KLGCKCLDWAAMCKHVAAVLYGVGARLDQQPELLFTLRGVDPGDLVSSTGANPSGAGAGPVSGKVLDNVDLGDVFGIDINTEPFADAPPVRSKRTRKEAASQTERTPRSTALKSSTIAKSTQKGKVALPDVKASASAVKKPKGKTDPGVSKATRSAASPKPTVRAPAASKTAKRRG